MDYFSANINQLVIESRTAKKTFVRSFASKPPKDLEKTRGKLFGLVEIQSDQPEIDDLITLIIDEIKIHYYSQSMFKISFSNDIESILEGALQRTNLSISSFLENTQMVLDLNKVNIIIGVIINREIYFTEVGGGNIFLLQYLKKSEYRIIDILKMTKTPLAPINPLKIFSQIISGHIGPRDIIFITTTNVLDYFSLEKLKNIITAPPTITEGIIELKKNLQNFDSQNNFGLLLVKIEHAVVKSAETIEDLKKNFNYQDAASHDSMKELIQNQKETQKFLSPSLFPEFKKSFSNLAAFGKDSANRLNNLVSNNLKRIVNPQKINLSKLKINPQLAKRLTHLPKKVSLPEQNLKNIRLAETVSPIFHKIAESFYWLYKKFIKFFYNLPTKGRIIFIVLVTLLIVLGGNIIFTSVKNGQAKTAALFNQAITDIENKKNEAEGSLIYRDENQARELLVVARDELQKLSAKSQPQKQAVEKLAAEINQQLEKLKHIVDISEPTLIFNFENLDAQSKTANLMLLSEKSVYVQNTRNQAIYKGNLQSRAISGIYSENITTGNFIAGFTQGKNIIFINQEKKAFSLNTSNNTLKNLNFPLEQNIDITDISSYRSWAYLLDQKNNQIYRYDIADSGLSGGKAWITDSQVALQDSKSLSIDGFVYVLGKAGDITKLDRGKKAVFKLNLIDPALAGPTKIKTAEGSKYIYILDPAGKRLVIINKDGKLIGQYTSAQFTDLKDFVFIESEKAAYLLNGNSVFGIPIDI